MNWALNLYFSQGFYLFFSQSSSELPQKVPKFFNLFKNSFYHKQYMDMNIKILLFTPWVKLEEFVTIFYKVYAQYLQSLWKLLVCLAGRTHYSTKTQHVSDFSNAHARDRSNFALCYLNGNIMVRLRCEVVSSAWTVMSYYIVYQRR